MKGYGTVTEGSLVGPIVNWLNKAEGIEGVVLCIDGGRPAPEVPGVEVVSSNRRVGVALAEGVARGRGPIYLLCSTDDLPSSECPADAPKHLRGLLESEPNAKSAGLGMGGDMQAGDNRSPFCVARATSGIDLIAGDPYTLKGARSAKGKREKKTTKIQEVGTVAPETESDAGDSEAPQSED